MSKQHKHNESESAEHEFVRESESESSHSLGTSYTGTVKTIHGNRVTKNSRNENMPKMKGQAKTLQKRKASTLMCEGDTSGNLNNLCHMFGSLGLSLPVRGYCWGYGMKVPHGFLNEASPHA
jgi:hypothetical protein